MKQEACKSCGKEALVKGTLEGVSFVPEAIAGKWISKGVYGIQAIVCAECGRFADLTLDPEALKRINQ
jgi:hypothetical protein